MNHNWNDSGDDALGPDAIEQQLRNIPPPDVPETLLHDILAQVPVWTGSGSENCTGPEEEERLPSAGRASFDHRSALCSGDSARRRLIAVMCSTAAIAVCGVLLLNVDPMFDDAKTSHHDGEVPPTTRLTQLMNETDPCHILPPFPNWQ